MEGGGEVGRASEGRAHGNADTTLPLQYASGFDPTQSVEPFFAGMHTVRALPHRRHSRVAPPHAPPKKPAQSGPANTARMHSGVAGMDPRLRRAFARWMAWKPHGHWRTLWRCGRHRARGGKSNPCCSVCVCWPCHLIKWQRCRARLVPMFGRTALGFGSAANGCLLCYEHVSVPEHIYVKHLRM